MATNRRTFLKGLLGTMGGVVTAGAANRVQAIVQPGEALAALEEIDSPEEWAAKLRDALVRETNAPSYFDQLVRPKSSDEEARARIFEFRQEEQRALNKELSKRLDELVIGRYEAYEQAPGSSVFQRVEHEFGENPLVDAHMVPTHNDVPLALNSVRFVRNKGGDLHRQRYFGFGHEQDHED